MAIIQWKKTDYLSMVTYDYARYVMPFEKCSLIWCHIQHVINIILIRNLGTSFECTLHKMRPYEISDALPPLVLKQTQCRFTSSYTYILILWPTVSPRINIYLELFHRRELNQPSNSLKWTLSRIVELNNHIILSISIAFIRCRAVYCTSQSMSVE